MVDVFITQKSRTNLKADLNFKIPHGQQHFVVLQQGRDKGHGLVREVLFKMFGMISCSPILNNIQIENQVAQIALNMEPFSCRPVSS